MTWIHLKPAWNTLKVSSKGLVGNVGRTLVAVGLALITATTGLAASPGDGLERWEAPEQNVGPVKTAVPVKNAVGDPVGDTIGGVVDLDLDRFSAFVDGDNLVLELGFATSFSPADSGQSDVLNGQIDLDTDRNPATGGPAGADTFCPPGAGIGVDATVSLASYSSVTGQMTLTDSGLGANSVNAIFTATAVRIIVPTAFLAGTTDGIVDASVIVGSPIAPHDCAPDSGFLVSSVPATVPVLGEIGLAALCGMLLLAGFLTLRRLHH